jgi:precorrin-3B synthase
MSTIKGWCPDLFAPMRSGDGLLIRIKPRFGTLAAGAARLLADQALAGGNGAIDVTNRANLQLRGFSDQTAERVQSVMVAQGLASADASVERRRNILVQPLADAETLAVAAGLEAALAGAHDLDRLPGKFGFAVDGGGRLSVSGLGGDVTLRRGQTGWRVTGQSGTARCAADRTATVALDQARSAAGRRAARTDGGAPGVIGDLGGGAFGVGVPPGTLDAALLRRLADLADLHGDGLLRITPWRAILLAGLTAASMETVAAALAGALTDPGDPRLRTACCIGAPGCAQASVPAPRDAARLASLVPAGLLLHVSGCDKGCGHPGAAALTLVGRAGRYGLVRNGRAGDRPEQDGLTLDAVADLLHVARSQDEGRAA